MSKHNSFRSIQKYSLLQADTMSRLLDNTDDDDDDNS